MKLVMDANVLFSSLIKEGLTRKILLEEEFYFYVPRFVISEFFEHMEELANKTKVNFTLLKRKMNEIFKLSNMNLVGAEEFGDFVEKAAKFSPDEDDIMYFALALKLNCPIWSNDCKLKEQRKIVIYSTEELTR